MADETNIKLAFVEGHPDKIKTVISLLEFQLFHTILYHTILYFVYSPEGSFPPVRFDAFIHFTLD